MKKELKKPLDKLTVIHGIVEKIVDAMSPEKIILFGSYAYGTIGPNSDIDLLVIWDTQLTRSERIRRISRLISPRPAAIDIVVRTPAEIEKSRHRVDPFLHEVLEKGIAIYARPE